MNALKQYGGSVNELALFAGAGGGLLGTQELGLKTVCAVELSEHRRCVLAQRQNERHLRHSFPIWDDIRTFDGRSWRSRVDVVSGGFPCQAFSTAARGRKNAANLWPDMFRVIKEVQPKYVFAENVTERAIDQAARDCASVGYKTELLSLSAKDLGADHTRERFWLLAYANDKGELQRTVNAEVAQCKEFHEGVWSPNPGDSGVVDGVSSRMDRYEATGNGQVPIVAAAALWSLVNADCAAAIRGQT